MPYAFTFVRGSGIDFLIHKFLHAEVDMGLPPIRFGSVTALLAAGFLFSAALVGSLVRFGAVGVRN